MRFYVEKQRKESAKECPLSTIMDKGFFPTGQLRKIKNRESFVNAWQLATQPQQPRSSGRGSGKERGAWAVLRVIEVCVQDSRFRPYCARSARMLLAGRKPTQALRIFIRFLRRKRQ